jgi:hypothetical protein
MKCTSLKRKCKACGWKNDRERVPTCPECHADMHCTAEAVPGYSVCRYHGGPVPARNFYGRGPMKDGSQSSFPLMRLASKYNQMTTDGKVLSNRAAIDLIDKRITQLLERVDIEEAPDRIKDLYEAWGEFKLCAVGSPEYIQARAEIDAIFERVYHDYAAWRQIFEALDLRGKTTEREIKALKEIRAIMTAEDGYELAAKLMAAVVRVIGDDPKKIKQVQYEFARIIGESSDRVGSIDAEDDGGGVAEAGGEEGSGHMDQA